MLAFIAAPPLVSVAHAKPGAEKRVVSAKTTTARGKVAQPAKVTTGKAGKTTGRKAGAKPASKSALATAKSEKAVISGQWKVETVMARGDTLIEVLRRHGIDAKQAHNAVDAVGDIFDPRRLDAGDKLTLMMERRANGPWLQALNLDPKSGQELTIQVARASSDGKPARSSAGSGGSSVVVRRTEGTVTKGIREAMLAAKVPAAVAADALAAFGTDPDLPRKPPKNSRFIVVYEAEQRRRGGLQNPTLRFAALNVKGKVHPVYRYEMDGGDVVFVGKDGRGVAQLDL